MSWRRLAKTVLALRGSGGIKAGKGSPPARALGAHAFFALPAALRILTKKKVLWLQSRGPLPAPRCSHSFFFFPFFLETFTKHLQESTFVSKIAF